MTEPLHFERSTSSDNEIGIEQSLERNDNLLPTEVPEWTLEGAAHRLNQPACRNVLAAQAGRIALPFHPARIDQQALGEGFLEAV